MNNKIEKLEDIINDLKLDEDEYNNELENRKNNFENSSLIIGMLPAIVSEVITIISILKTSGDPFSVIHFAFGNSIVFL